MDDISIKSDLIIIRNTQEEDLGFVVSTECDADNAQYIGQWTKEQHKNALLDEDILHLIVEDMASIKPVKNQKT